MAGFREISISFVNSTYRSDVLILPTANGTFLCTVQGVLTPKSGQRTILHCRWLPFRGQPPQPWTLMCSRLITPRMSQEGNRAARELSLGPMQLRFIPVVAGVPRWPLLLLPLLHCKDVSHPVQLLAVGGPLACSHYFVIMHNAA